MIDRRVRSASLVAVLLALSMAGCGMLATQPPDSTGGPGGGPGASAGAERGAAAIRAQLAAALSARNLILADAKVPFRPPEPPDVAALPRVTYQVQLRDDPQNGFIVVYDLPTPEAAAATGRSLADYLASGPGRVQAPAGTAYVLRQVGSSLVYYRWLPGAIVDPETPKVQAALETIGIGIAVAR